MLASHRWLMELSGLDLASNDVAARFTASGIEVEGIHDVGGNLDGVVVAEVRAVRPHPKREKLRLVTVFDGAAEHEVVCGAPNVPEPGGRVLLARLGAKLPGGLEIAERELGGVVSRGMLCSERELDLGLDESGILVLDASISAAPGTSAATALRTHDTIYDLSLTPNRADCLGHVGLARELCVLFGVPFTAPRAEPATRLAPTSALLFSQRESVFSLAVGEPRAAGDAHGFAPVRVDVRDAERCPRYGAALVFGLGVAPSPFWLRRRLHVLGVRSISNVVDATNYVLQLFGQPIHAFDYDHVRGSRIEVRLARAGERMRTLDGIDRELSDDDLLICDGQGPVALAGVMGGEGSEIRAETQRVLIECAYFDPRSVRRTSKRSGLHTDSSHRFERGVDPSAVREVLAYTASLIANLASGTVLDDALDVVSVPITACRIALRMARVEALLGQAIDTTVAEGFLFGLGCELSRTAFGFEVSAPLHRPDLTREVDLIEELARLVGYDTLPSELPRITPSEEGTPAAIQFVRRMREAAASAGLDEAINYAFVSPVEIRATRAPALCMRIVNPMSEDRSVMRTSLLPGLAANLQRAQRQQLKTFGSFELARVFRPRASEVLPDEAHEFGFLLWGQRGLWYGEGDPYDFYDAKAAATSVVRIISGRDPETHEDPALDHDAPELHPKRRARLVLAGQPIGMLGELHPDVVQASGLEGRPVWCRINVASLAAEVSHLGPTRAVGMPRYPSATRDLAVVVAEAVMAGHVASVLRDAAGPLAEDVRLFDVYRGEPVPAEHKSLAFRVVYRDAATTLTDKLVDELHGKLLRAAEQRFGASLRR